MPSGVDGGNLNAGHSRVAVPHYPAALRDSEAVKNESTCAACLKWEPVDIRGLDSQSCSAAFLSKQIQTAMLEMPPLSRVGFLLPSPIFQPTKPLVTPPVPLTSPPQTATRSTTSPRPSHLLPLTGLIVYLVIPTFQDAFFLQVCL